MVPGECACKELPVKYRRTFMEGKAHLGSADFIPLSFDVVGKSLLLLIMGPVFILPPAFLDLYLRYVLLTKPQRVGDLLLEVYHGGLGSVAVFVVITLLIIALMAYMLFEGFTLTIRLYQTIAGNQAAKAESHHYGLILDEDSLVIRMKDDQGKDRCIFLPVKTLQAVEMRKKWMEMAKLNKYVMHIYLIFQQEHGGRNEIELNPAEFDPPPEIVFKRLQTWFEKNREL